MHVDMDAFFASVEQIDNPQLAGKPVIVGGSSERSVVATCSYEARKYGVHSAMSMVQAKRLCPHGIIVPVRMSRYKYISGIIMKIFRDSSPVVEQLSIDEAFLDITGMEHIYQNPRHAGMTVKQRIFQETRLTASVGIAPNKFLAKMASDLQKPDGLTIITHGQARSFIADFPVTKIFGIGAAAENLLGKYGIQTIGQLAEAEQHILQKVFGKNWHNIQLLAQGIDDRPVVPDALPKSIGREITLAEDIYSLSDCCKILLDLSEQTGFRLRKKGFSGRTLTVKVKFRDFKVHTKSITCESELCCDEEIYKLAVKLLKSIELNNGVRLLGVTVSNLIYDTPCILGYEEDAKLMQRNKAIDNLKSRFGENIIKRGSI